MKAIKINNQIIHIGSGGYTNISTMSKNIPVLKDKKIEQTAKPEDWEEKEFFGIAFSGVQIDYKEIYFETAEQRDAVVDAIDELLEVQEIQVPTKKAKK